MIYLGIDPGKKGGIAVIEDSEEVRVYPMPQLPKGKDMDIPVLLGILKDLTAMPVMVCIEKCGARPGQGVVSMFKFGCGYGILQGLMMGLQYPYELVRPQEWKKLVLKGTAKEKEDAIAWCQRAYPTVSLLPSPRSRVPSDGMAEALCIADYCRRTHGREPGS